MRLPYHAVLFESAREEVVDECGQVCRPPHQHGQILKGLECDLLVRTVRNGVSIDKSMHSNAALLETYPTTPSASNPRCDDSDSTGDGALSTSSDAAIDCPAGWLAEVLVVDYFMLWHGIAHAHTKTAG